MTQDSEYRRLVRLAGGMNKRAAALGIPGRITASDLRVLQAARFNRCTYCGIYISPGTGTFDHVVPLDKGGRNTFMNVVSCCIVCNRTKYTKTPEQFAEHQALEVECAVCGTRFKPRYAEYQRGDARICSRRCAALKRWHGVRSSPGSRQASTTPTPTTTAVSPRPARSRRTKPPSS